MVIFLMQVLHSYAQMERYSIRNILYVIGTRTLIAYKVNDIIPEIMKSVKTWDRYRI